MARARFTEAVEANRIGTIFAHDAKQYGAWRRDADRRAGRAVAGTTLEQLAREYPDHVALPN